MPKKHVADHLPFFIIGFYETVNQKNKHYHFLEALHTDHFLVFKLLDVDACQLWKQWR